MSQTPCISRTKICDRKVRRVHNCLERTTWIERYGWLIGDWISPCAIYQLSKQMLLSFWPTHMLSHCLGCVRRLHNGRMAYSTSILWSFFRKVSPQETSKIANWPHSRNAESMVYAKKEGKLGDQSSLRRVLTTSLRSTYFLKVFPHSDPDFQETYRHL